MQQRQWAIVTALGGVAIVIGSLLPWTTFTAGLVGTVSVAGTEGDGMLTLAGGVVIGLLGFGAYITGRPTFAVPAAIASGVIVWLAFNDGTKLAEHFKTLGTGIRATIGIGLWLVGAGGVLGAIAGFLAGRNAAARPDGPAWPTRYCGRCTKLLSPVWTKCEHCRARFEEFPPTTAKPDGTLTVTYMKHETSAPPGAVPPPTVEPATPLPAERSLAGRLTQLDEARKAGLISEEEHAARRAKILDEA